jgi:hypothetical protein
MILKDWKNIVKLYKCSAIWPGRKRLRLGDFSKVEEAVNTWLKQVCSTGVPVSGPMIETKKFASLMNTDNFEASAEWLFHFRENYSISWEVVCDEEMTVNVDAAKESCKRKTEKCFEGIFP